MQIVQLLEHHGVVVDGLRMEAFLPDLMPTAGLVSRPIDGEPVEQPVAAFVGQLGTGAGGHFPTGKTHPAQAD